MKKELYLGLFLLSIPLVSAEYYPILGAADFGSIYIRFGVFIDAIIYLFIFLGLTKMVFGPKAGQPEEHAKKILYIGLALFLTIGLLLFQSVNRFSLLESAGSWAMFLIFLLVILSSYSMVSSAVKNKWAVAGLTILLSLIFLEGLVYFWNGSGFLIDFLKSGIHRWGLLVALVLLIIGGIKKFGLKASVATEPLSEKPEVIIPERIGVPRLGYTKPEEEESAGEIVQQTEEEKARLDEEINQRSNLIVEKIKQELKTQNEAEKKKLLDDIENLRKQIEANVIEAKQKDQELRESFDRATFKLENKAEIYKERYKLLAEKYRKAREQRSPEVLVLQEQIKQLQNQITRIGEAKTRILKEKTEVTKPKPYVPGILAEAWDELMKKEPLVLEYPVFTRKWFEREKGERAGLVPLGAVKRIEGEEPLKIMREKPEEIEPAEEEAEQKIRYHITRMDETLEFMSKRKVFQKKSQAEFVRLLLRGKEPKALYLSMENLTKLQEYVIYLSKLFDRYLRIRAVRVKRLAKEKKKPTKKLRAFEFAIYNTKKYLDQLDFTHVVRFTEIKDRVLDIARGLDEEFAKIDLAVQFEQSLRGKGELFGTVEALVEKHEKITPEYKSKLITRLNNLRAYIDDYQNVLLKFNADLVKARTEIKKVIRLRAQPIEAKV